jgi:hypothetical protein
MDITGMNGRASPEELAIKITPCGGPPPNLPARVPSYPGHAKRFACNAILAAFELSHRQGWQRYKRALFLEAVGSRRGRLGCAPGS